MLEERKRPLKPVPPFRPVDIKARIEIDARIPEKLKA